MKWIMEKSHMQFHEVFARSEGHEKTSIHLAPIVKDISGYERLRVEPHLKNEKFLVMKEDDNVTIKNDESSHKSDLAFYDTSGVVDTAWYEVLVIVDQVAENSISLETFQLFDIIVDIVKSEYLVSKQTILQTSTNTLFVTRSPGELCVWFNVLSPVQKHEWEPPP
ncbi:unnamed protein product [Cuscuta campestris]|uniref:Uncharacterized protein n=1 Tax=Cuscuta campestris TaxID=132261 RepID=A0A484LMS9_9ASTE|nr:unnamed protein product [Cuscuta campestris]